MARILYFSRDYTTHDHRFLSALAQEHQVYFLRLEKNPRQLEDRPLPPGVEMVSWAGGEGPARLSNGVRLLNDLRRVLRQVQPDLVQSGPIQRSAFLVALSGFSPLVSMSWGYDLIYDAGRSFLWRWATRFTLRRSRLMIGDCQAIRSLARQYGMRDEDTVIFPWGIDLEQFPYAPLPDGPAFTLLSTRSWEPIYGVDIIAQAFASAARQIPELHLVMLGGGSQANLLRTTFSQAGVLGRVHFPGQVSQADLPRFHRMANLYISASHSDGTSISLLEALATGRPALVSDIYGNREWVRPAETGWLFPDGDANALSQAIAEAAHQRHRLPEMGRVAREVAQQRADWRKNFPILLNAYRSVLSS
jgi:glycosyltransferase involved in cell wall biosynthesis